MQGAARAKFKRTGRIPPPQPEPAKKKCHWDYLLEEMKWMQNEFSKERRAKLKQLKQTAVKASRSKMDLISRREVRVWAHHPCFSAAVRNLQRCPSKWCSHRFAMPAVLSCTTPKRQHRW